MPLKVACAKCGGVLHAPDDAGGKKGKCPNCGNILPIPLDAPKVTDSVGGAEGVPAGSNPIPRPTEPRGFGSTQGIPTAASGRTAESKPFPSSPPPNPFSPPDQSRQSKVARPSTQPVTFTASPSGRKGWARARRGLWWVRTGVFLLLRS